MCVFKADSVLHSVPVMPFLIISLLLTVIYSEGTCSFVFGFALEEFAVVYGKSGKAI